ncbi:hypothetical protein N9446_00075 [bacterium]|jgi:hypothetical protein|nr:hypothetical protein [bacterium]
MVRIGSRHQEDDQTQQTLPSVRNSSGGVRIGSRHDDDYIPPPANEATPTIDEPPSPTDEVGIDIVEENSKVDDILIQEYLSSSEPYYDEEYLRGLDSQKLTDVLYEENPQLVEKHLPNLFGQITEEEAQGEFAGQEARPRENLTWREKSENTIVNSLVSSGVTKDRRLAREIARDVVGNPNTDSIVESIGVADLSPVGAVYALNEAYDEIKRLSNSDADIGEYALPAIDVTLSALEGFFLAKPIAKIGKKIIKGKGPVVDTTDEILEKLDKKAEASKEKYLKRKFQVDTAKINTDADIDAKQALAAEKAAGNREITSEFIDVFEKQTGKTISDVSEDGLKTLNETKAREAGLETLDNINAQTEKNFFKTLGDDATARVDDAILLAGQGDSLTRPVLRQEKLDGLVAAAAELKEKNPTAFDNNKTIIDNLLEATLTGELIPGDVLLDTLNKYDVSFEDYVLGVVGSGSEAGRTLAQLSKIKRQRPLNEIRAMQEAAKAETDNVIRKTFLRTENIRRGGLVSQVATAVRNLQSGGIRAPLEGLGNVIDTALYNYSQEGFRAGVKSLVPGSGTYKDSFRHMKYMFSGDALDVKEYVDFILKQPELSKQYDLMFNNINEIQKMTGRGEAKTYFGKKVDGVLSMAEDAVDVLNAPNRWQEHLLRRGAFLGELERLVKREWGIDLVENINQGKIRDMLNDAGTVRPKNGRSFNDLIADATTRALDITYAKAPDIGVFRSTSQFIVRNGLTVVLPFPRFMFNSMELMGQYMGGASIPLAKKLANVVSGNKAFPDGSLTAKDRQRISRNIVGSGTLPAIFAFSDDDKDDEDKQILGYAADFLMSMSVIGAAYQYRMLDDAPSDYKLMKTSSGTNLDTTPQYPMRQFLWLGEATKRLMDGTYDDWFDGKEFGETFLGTNVRQGVGNSIIDEVANLATGQDLVGDEKLGKLAGRPIAAYLSSWFVPFGQIIEAQRAVGIRGTEFKDTGYDPELSMGDTFMKELSRPFKRYYSPRAEADTPNKEFLFAEKKERVAPILRVLGGLNITTADEPYGEYITSFGYTEYELSSKSKVNSIRNAENKYLRDALPDIVDVAKGYEDQLRTDYKESDETFRAMQSEEKYVSANMRLFLKSQIESARNEISSDGKSLLADAPTKMEYMSKYRRLKQEARSVATIQFEREYGREPDVVNSLEDLIDLAIRGEEYQKAYK